MKEEGIRISDKKDGVLSASLADILGLVKDGHLYHWLLLFIDGVTYPEYGEYITAVQISSLKSGFIIAWGDLLNLSSKFSQLYEIVLIGSKNSSVLHRYDTESEMYQACDIVIEMIDCAYWEVHSKSEVMITESSKIFREVEKIS